MFYNIIFGAYDSVAPPTAPNMADRTAIAICIIFFHITQYYPIGSGVLLRVNETIGVEPINIVARNGG